MLIKPIEIVTIWVLLKLIKSANVEFAIVKIGKKFFFLDIPNQMMSLFINY